MGLDDDDFEAELEANEDEITDVGFKYYYILARLQDIHGDNLPARESKQTFFIKYRLLALQSPSPDNLNCFA